MRGVLIAGGVLTLIGLVILVRGLSYTREESLFKLGEFEAKVKQERSVPEWLGGVALGAGIVLVVVGMKRR